MSDSKPPQHNKDLGKACEELKEAKKEITKLEEEVKYLSMIRDHMITWIDEGLRMPQWLTDEISDSF